MPGINTDTEIQEVDDGTGTSVPPAARDLQETIRDRLTTIRDRLTSLLDTAGNWGDGYDNTLSPGNTDVQTLAAGSVPDGVTVLVQADPDNAAPVKVGLSGSPVIRVAPGQVYECQPADRSQVRVQLEDAADSVHVSHEVSV